MPSHTPSSALIKLYFIGGAPWQWDAWKDRTGILHGIFPSDDDDLPLALSRQDVIDIQSYFNAYQEQKSEDDKITFATRTRGTAAYPGRKTWNSFVSKYWNRWRIHTVIVEELKDWNVHPYDIVLREHLQSVWPASDNYIPVILDTLGMRLFGEDAFLEGTSVLRSDLRGLLKIFVQRSWRRIRNHISKVKARAITVEGDARQAFADLEEGELTRAKVNKAIRAVAKWKECSEILSTPQSIKTAEEMLDDLKDIMETLGAKVSVKRSEKPKVPLKVSKQALKTLASQEDVTDLLNAYHEYFEAFHDEGDEALISDSLPTETQGQLMDDPNVGDFGMEMEAKMDPKQLARALGFKNHLPFSFNVYRHKLGTSPWENENLFKPHVDADQPLPQYIEFMKLHWHQLAGVHSIVRSVFLDKPDDSHPAGVLVGDEVGLGKTAQSIAFIAFLNQVLYVKSKGLPPPPILTTRPYLGSSQTIPSLPHLILCPGTIAGQWVSELKTLFIPWSIDIFLYDSRTNNASSFWGPEGPLQTSKHDPHNRIVVATHSVVFTEFKKLHTDTPRKDSRPWLIPPVISKKTTAGTIFGQRFLTITVDEAHHMRNAGNKHLSILRLLQQAKIRLVMTATPLHTAPKDIASLGRLVGIHHFSDEASFLEDKDDATVLRRAKKMDDDGASLLREQVKIVRRQQKHCIGHFLRRTTASLSWEGNVLLPLPEPKEIIGLIQLTEREEQIIAERAKAAKDAVESSCKRIYTKKFYLEYRLAVAYAKEDADELTPRFNTLDQWEPLKSTKMDACAKICMHYLKHDLVDDVSFEEGKLNFPDVLDIPGEKLPRRRRIIIYSEFPSMAPLLQNVLRLYGVESLTINGEIPFQQRDKRVKEFYDDKHPARVLIFSAVAAVGLNLAIADVVIFFDQPWSAQDERQVRGRAHRQPQKKVVRVIHLLAINSADTVMYSVARGKENMFDAFVNKDLADELRNLLQGGLTDDPEDNPTIDDEDSSAQKPKTRKSRRSKKSRRILDEEENVRNALVIEEHGMSSGADGDNRDAPVGNRGQLGSGIDEHGDVRTNMSDGNDIRSMGSKLDDDNTPTLPDGEQLTNTSDGEVPGVSDGEGLSSIYQDSNSEADLTRSFMSTNVGHDSDNEFESDEDEPMRGASPPEPSPEPVDMRGASPPESSPEPVDMRGASPLSPEPINMRGASPPSPEPIDMRGASPLSPEPINMRGASPPEPSPEPNNTQFRGPSSPSPPFQPPVKRARRGSLGVGRCEDFTASQSQIQLARRREMQTETEATSTLQSRDGMGHIPSLSPSTNGMNTAEPTSLRGSKRRKNPFAANRPRSSLADLRSTSNPPGARRSVFLSPKRSNPHAPPDPAPSHPQSQPTLTVSREQSQLSMMQARARQKSFTQTPDIEPVSRLDSPTPSGSNIHTHTRARVLSLTQPSVSVRTSARENLTANVPSPSITRPRQPGSTAVPPKDALKYTRKRN